MVEPDTALSRASEFWHKCFQPGMERLFFSRSHLWLRSAAEQTSIVRLSKPSAS